MTTKTNKNLLKWKQSKINTTLCDTVKFYLSTANEYIRGRFYSIGKYRVPPTSASRWSLGETNILPFKDSAVGMLMSLSLNTTLSPFDFTSTRRRSSDVLMFSFSAATYLIVSAVELTGSLRVQYVWSAQYTRKMTEIKVIANYKIYLHISVRYFIFLSLNHWGRHGPACLFHRQS